MNRMGVQPILPVKVSVSVVTMLNFNGDFNRHGDCDVTCKQTFTSSACMHLFTRSYLRRTLRIEMGNIVFGFLIFRFVLTTCLFFLLV